MADLGIEHLAATDQHAPTASRSQSARMMTRALQKTQSGITYQERPGPGPTLVILHGIGSHAASFEGVLDRMPAPYRVIAWNAPGYGGSTPLPMDWPRATDYAKTLGDVLDDLNIATCTVLGHSLGTLIAAAFAQRMPHKLSRLILASSAQGYGVTREADMPASVASRIADLNAQGAAAFAKSRAPRLVHNPDTAPDVVAQVEAAMAQVTPSGYAQAVRMLAAGDLAGTLAHITAPCHFIIGAEDQVTPMAQTQAAADAWGGGPVETIIRIEQAGHAVYIQKPDDFVAALLSALQTDAALTGGSND